jgi:hypothetical protein
MKTVFAPDTAAAFAADLQAVALAHPVLAFAVLIAATALFARFAARQF